MLGRPRKYCEGWEKSNAKVRIYDYDMLERWQELRKKLDFESDNLVAINLPQRNELLAKIEVAGDYLNNRCAIAAIRMVIGSQDYWNHDH